jgi:K+-transporting ATPase ATPase C chain
MSGHVRANICLLVFTVALCCGVYPLTLWAIGQAAFPHQSNGSLVQDKKSGKLLGSTLIAQEFKGDEWFQPRPSAASFKGEASGASNWGANNYQLRDRVARALGPIVKYKSGPKKGQEAAADIVAWFRTEQPSLVAEWAKAHSGLAQNWVKSEDVTKDFVKAWFEKHPADLAAWKKENPDKADPAPDDLAVAFFESFSREHPATWLAVNDSKDKKNEKGEPVKIVELVPKSAEDAADISGVFFDLWLQAHPNVELEDVPADLVMASASGLDPHITLKNANYQLDRVAAKWAESTKTPAADIRRDIESILSEIASAPLGGLAGEKLVNVLEVNHALKERFAHP